MSGDAGGWTRSEDYLAQLQLTATLRWPLVRGMK